MCVTSCEVSFSYGSNFIIICSISPDVASFWYLESGCIQIVGIYRLSFFSYFVHNLVIIDSVVKFL